uniref:Uncharacterized protein n=1 Tax=Terrapene triunguis TaxID=2587831 RepID=A0A674ICF5_9SAUR
MGTFQGQALPGTFFLLFGLWLAVKCPLKYLYQKINPSFASFLAKHMPLSLAILAERFVPTGPHLHLYTGKERTWVPMNTWQHLTMYLSFLFPGEVDMLTCFLFHFHVRNRSALQQHVHLLLIVALCGDALSLHLEVFVPHHPRPISFVLYPPGGWPDWDQMDDGNIMFSTRCVCWHYVAALIISPGQIPFLQREKGRLEAGCPTFQVSTLTGALRVTRKVSLPLKLLAKTA